MHFVTHAWNFVAVVAVLGSMYHAEVMESIRGNNFWNIAGRCTMKWSSYSNNVRKEMNVKVL